MIIIDYKKNSHRQIIQAGVKALREGKILVYPTDTSYGLACDITNPKAVAKFYKTKERLLTQPVHVVVPSISYAKSLVAWNRTAAILAKNFWPGPLTIILPQAFRQSIELVNRSIKRFSAKTKTLGLRMPNNSIALDLAATLGEPIPATSANPSARASGGYDSYSVRDIVAQFSTKKNKPDVIIDAGILPRRRPSTLVKIEDRRIDILRPGPITKNQIMRVLN